MTEQSPLFVRLPSSTAERLDRAAFALGASKKDVVTALLQRHVDPDTPGGLDSLRREVFEAGELPARRIGDAWRFSRAAVLDWLGGS